MATGLVLTEQRRLPRRELIYYLKITDGQTGLELGRLADLHAEGMMILSEKPLSTGSPCEVYLELPKAIQAENKREALRLEGKIVWTRPGPRPAAYYENGFRFSEAIDQGQQAILQQLITAFSMPGSS
jgi:hypothetical protein